MGRDSGKSTFSYALIFVFFKHFFHLQHYLQLYFFKKKFENIKHANDSNSETADEASREEGSVFDESVTLLQRLESELISEISVSVLLDVKAKSRNYRTDKLVFLSIRN